MKLWKAALCGAVASLGVGGTALAEETKPTIALNVGVASEYLFRGLSQTRGKAEVFGGADVTYGMVYAGTWISNVDFGKPAGNTTDAEIDVYGGVRPKLGPVTLDLGGIAYLYAKQPSGLAGTENYFEFKAAASVPVGPATLGGLVAYSPEFPTKTGHATYVEANLAVPIPGVTGLTASGAIGYQDLDQAKAGINGYATWNVGLTYAFNSHVSIDGRYIGASSAADNFYGTNRHIPFNSRDRFVATLKVVFP